MVKKGAFENQEKPRRSRYGNRKKKDSIVDSDVKSAGLAERGEAVSRELVPASFIETCQEKVSGMSVTH
jgi:hypothetical protein